jgi:hypothetical protein
MALESVDLVGRWYCVLVDYEWPPREGESETVTLAQGRESAFRSFHQESELTFEEDGSWRLDSGDGYLDSFGTWRVDAGRLEAGEDEAVEHGHLGLVYARASAETVRLAFEQHPDAYDTEPVEALLFVRERPRWRQPEPMTPAEQLILAPGQVEEILDENGVEIPDVAAEVWRALADGRLELRPQSWTHPFHRDLLLWTGMEKGFDAAAAVAVVQRLVPNDDYTLAAGLAPLVLREIDAGLELELDDDWADTLERERERQRRIDETNRGEG